MDNEQFQELLEIAWYPVVALGNLSCQFQSDLGLRPHERVLIVAELHAGFLPAEAPVDLDLVAIDLAVPSACLPLEQGQTCDSPLSQTLPAEQTNFDLGLVQPTAVFGCVVNRETVPKIPALFLSKVVCEGLPAVDIEIVHDQMDGSSKRIAADDSIQDAYQLGRRAIRGRESKMFARLRLTAQKTLAVPQR